MIRCMQGVFDGAAWRRCARRMCDKTGSKGLP